MLDPFTLQARDHQDHSWPATTTMEAVRLHQAPITHDNANRLALRLSLSMIPKLNRPLNCAAHHQPILQSR